MIVKKPTLLIDKDKVIRNIQRIAFKTEATQTSLYPHFKTHQSIEVGNWFKQEGIRAITVSSVSMAKYFANNGWTNIYIAFPINVNELEDIARLAAKVELSLLANEEVQVERLGEVIKDSVKIKIEIETGSNRSGIAPEDQDKIKRILQLLSESKHKFDGFYSHFGHTYGAKSTSEVIEVYNSSRALLEELKVKFVEYAPTISIGDTPSASILDNYQDLKSVHAGNFVFYDLTQEQIGVCKESDIAIALAVPIVSKNVTRSEFVVYGGGIHLSKEVLLDRKVDKNTYGRIVEFGDETWSPSLEECYVSSISQEHGVVKVTQEIFTKYSIGDSIGILPVHSCMTADCMGSYLTLDGQKVDHFKGSIQL